MEIHQARERTLVPGTERGQQGGFLALCGALALAQSVTVPSLHAAGRRYSSGRAPVARNGPGSDTVDPRMTPIDTREASPDEQAEDGSFRRHEARFRDRVTADGSSGYRAEPGRYHLYCRYACPWSHRTILYRSSRVSRTRSR